MSYYTDYLNEIDNRKNEGLHPKPIEDAVLVQDIISHIRDTDSEHREACLNFLIYNTIPGQRVQRVKKPAS